MGGCCSSHSEEAKDKNDGKKVKRREEPSSSAPMSGPAGSRALSTSIEHAASVAHASENEERAMAEHKTIYEFTVKGVDGEDVSLEKYRGQVVVIVNVASYCGLTSTNYKQLKVIQDKYFDKGLRVAAFPCNQFGGQEPACELDIKNFVRENFDYEPELYGKVSVNGADTIPLYSFLKKEAGGSLVDAIKWNFTKFLVDRKGHVIKRFSPTTEPLQLVADIEKCLAEPA